MISLSVDHATSVDVIQPGRENTSVYFNGLYVTIRNTLGQFFDITNRVWVSGNFFTPNYPSEFPEGCFHISNLSFPIMSSSVDLLDSSVSHYTYNYLPPEGDYIVEIVESFIRDWFTLTPSYMYLREYGYKVVSTFAGQVESDPVIANAPPLTFVSKVGGNAPFDMTENFGEVNSLIVVGNYIYVADACMNRVVKLNKSDFSFVAQVGSGNQLARITTSGNPWVPFESNELSAPVSLASDGTHLYILEDYHTHRVQKRLLSDLSFVGSFGLQYNGMSPYPTYDGNGFQTGFDVSFLNTGLGMENALYSPRSMCSDGTYIYVLDSYRIVKLLCSNMSFVSQHGTEGSGNNQFSDPNSISCSGGFLYVSDKGNLRIIKLNTSDLSYVSQIATEGWADNFSSQANVTYLYCDSNYLYDKMYFTPTFGVTKLEKRSLDTMAIISSYKITDAVGQYVSDIDRNNFNYISCMCTDGADVYFGETIDLSHLASDTPNLDNDFEYYLSYQESGNGYSVNMDPRSYTASKGKITVRSVSDLTVIINRFYNARSGDNDFLYPVSITGDNTYLYVLDAKMNTIDKRLKSDLSLVSRVGTFGSSDDDFFNPRGITCNGGYLYIVDGGNNRILKYNASTLNYVSKVSESSPWSIACDGTYLYITSFNAWPESPLFHRVTKRLASDLSFVTSVGNLVGRNSVQFNSPIGITTDGTHVFVQDASRITKRLCSNLSFVAEYGEPFTNPESLNNSSVINHRGLTCDSDYLYSCDSQRLMVLDKLDLSYVTKLDAPEGFLWNFHAFIPISNDYIPKLTSVYVDSNYVYFTDHWYHQIQKRVKSNTGLGASSRNLLNNKISLLRESILGIINNRVSELNNRFSSMNLVIQNGDAVGREIHSRIYGRVGLVSVLDNVSVSSPNISVSTDSSQYYIGGKSLKILLNNPMENGSKVIFNTKEDGGTVDLSKCGTVGFQVYSMISGSYLKLRLSEDGSYWFEVVGVVNSSLSWSRWEASIIGMQNRSNIKYVELEYLPYGASMDVDLITSIYDVDSVDHPSIWVDDIEGSLSPMLYV